MGGAKVIEVSPRETDLSVTADMLLLGTAAEVLPQLYEVVQQKLADRQKRKLTETENPDDSTSREKPASSSNDSDSSVVVNIAGSEGSTRNRRIVKRRISTKA